MKFFPILFLFLANLVTAQDGKIILEGNYAGKNLFIQNPYDSDGKGFCTKKVLVNGKEYPIDSTKSSGYEIDLKWLGFKDGDTLKIEIFHSDGCKPKVLNPEVSIVKSRALFNFRIEKDSILKWQTLKESLNFPYYIEQYRWNKWVKWEGVKCTQNGSDTLFFSVNLKKYLHSGRNDFRAVTTSYNRKIITKTVSIQMPEEKEPQLWQGGMHYATNPVDLKKVTHWQLYDQYGKLLKQGYSQTFFINDLKKGSYYLNFDNKMTEIGWY